MDHHTFLNQLNKYLLPSSPIRREELLKGRTKQLEQIEETFYTKGRHVFIHGPRGVGKTSLATTSAQIYQSSDADPLVVLCDHTTTVFTLCRDIASQCLREQPHLSKRTITKERLFNLKSMFSAKRTELEEFIKVPTPTSLSECIQA